MGVGFISQTDPLYVGGANPVSKLGHHLVPCHKFVPLHNYQDLGLFPQKINK